MVDFLYVWETVGFQYPFFMELSRLKGRKTCDRLLKRSQVWKGNTMIIRWCRGAPRRPDADPVRPALYVGTLASAKMQPSAVKRNRMRRRCREALRKAVLLLDQIGPVQVMLAPRSASLHCPWGDIERDIASFLRILR